MFNISTEMPSGACSRGYDRETEEEALKCFECVKAQLTEAGFVGDVVLRELGEEVQRESIDASRQRK